MQITREFQLEAGEFEWIRAQIKERTGIALSDQKRDLVYNRLAGRLRSLGISSFRDYRRVLESEGGEFVEFTNALTTNVTAFFREPHHFEYLKKAVFPKLQRENKRKIRIWSAGCSSGEEPYTIAMTALETFGDRSSVDVKILATDLDTNVLAKAEAGVYGKDRLGGLDEARLSRWFQRGVGPTEGKVRARAELRELITFRQLNLMESWPMRGPFDLIFCRNVIIYFDRPTQTRLIDRYGDLLVDQGTLMLGHSESLVSERHQFKCVGRTIHQKQRG